MSTDVAGTLRRSPKAWAPLLVGITALVVAGWRVWVPGLWYDEFVTVTMAQRSWSSLLSTIGTVDAVHGAYYSMMHLWLNVVPYSPFTLRLPSVVAVALTAAVVTRIGSVEWNWVAGVAAGLVFTAIPRVSWMATQGRSYALATLLGSLTVLVFLRCLRDGRLRNWVVLGASTALSIMVFVYNALVVVVLGAVLMMLGPRRDQVRRFLLATAAGAMAALPVVTVAAGQRGQIGWIDRTTALNAATAPYYAFLDGVDSVYGALGWVILFGVSAAAMSRGKGSAEGPLTHRATLALVFGWLLLPVVVLLSAGMFLDVYHPTYVAISTPALALLVGAGVAARRLRSGGLVVVVVIVAALAYQPWQFFREADSKTPVLEVVSTIDALKRPGDLVWFVDEGTWITRQLRYGYPDTFTDLPDLTIESTFEESDTFFGTSRPIGDVVGLVGDTNRIIGVVSGVTEPPATLTEDLSIVEAAGFRRVHDVTVGDWRVFVLDRL